MVQNETRGFSFRKNSKKDGRREKSGVGFQYIMYILSVQKKKSGEETFCIRTMNTLIVRFVLPSRATFEEKSQKAKRIEELKKKKAKSKAQKRKRWS